MDLPKQFFATLSLLMILSACTAYQNDWPTLTDPLPKASERYSESHAPLTPIEPFDTYDSEALTKTEALALYRAQPIDASITLVETTVQSLKALSGRRESEAWDLALAEVHLALSRLSEVQTKLKDSLKVLQRGEDKTTVGSLKADVQRVASALALARLCLQSC